jgi:hypothetical protein
MWDLSKAYRPTLQVQSSVGFTKGNYIHWTVYSTDCRHTFCATCLYEWWATSRATTCPSCRTVCDNIPVRDRFANGLASLVSGNPKETVKLLGSNKFLELMIELEAEARKKEAEEAMEAEEIMEAEMVMEEQQVMAMRYAQLEGVGTPADPLDLTQLWN